MVEVRSSTGLYSKPVKSSRNPLDVNLEIIASSQKNIDSEKYMLFLGSGRSGSTAFGAFLNMHPNVAISWERRLLQKSHEKNRPIQKFKRQVLRESRRTKQNPYLFGGGVQTLSVWQPAGQDKWSSLEGLSPSLGETLAYGDKKSGGNSKFINENALTHWLLQPLNVIPIVTLRDPVDIFISKRRLGMDSNRALQENWFALHVADEVRRFPNLQALLIFYERTCLDPAATLNDALQAFELPSVPGWVEAGALFLARESSQTDLKLISGLSKHELSTLNDQRQSYKTIMQNY